VIKKAIIKKIMITTIAIFTVMIAYTFKLIPTNEISNFYHTNNTGTNSIYVFDEDNYVVKTDIYINEELTTEEKIKQLLESMTDGNNRSILLKEHFMPVLPEGTKVLNVSLKDKIARINFSDELLNIDLENEEKMIEAITYTITELKDVLGVEIYVLGNLLKYLPNSLSKLPAILTEDYGINKVYKLENLEDINKVFCYYLKKERSDTYYVPVTKYVNDNREKIEIIIEELTSNYIYEENLMSYLNSNARLIDYEIEDNGINLYFNEYIFNNDDKIIEEVIYTLSNSVFLNYDVDNLSIFVNNLKITEIIRGV